jgi:hypothetical protein
MSMSAKGHERSIIHGLRQRLMAPKFVEEFVRAFHSEINLQRRGDDALYQVKKGELAGVARKLNGLIDAIAPSGWLSASWSRSTCCR